MEPAGSISIRGANLPCEKCQNLSFYFGFLKKTKAIGIELHTGLRFNTTSLKSSYILKRPQIYDDISQLICRLVKNTKSIGRFRLIFWPPENILTLFTLISNSEANAVPL